MKPFYYLLCILLLSTPTLFSQLSKEQKEQEEQIHTQLILQNVGGMFLSFLKMLEDPENAQHALPQIGNVLQHAFNLGIVMTRGEQNEDPQEKIRALLDFFETEEGKSVLEEWQLDVSTRAFSIVSNAQ